MLQSKSANIELKPHRRRKLSGEEAKAADDGSGDADDDEVDSGAAAGDAAAGDAEQAAAGDEPGAKSLEPVRLPAACLMPAA